MNDEATRQGRPANSNTPPFRVPASAAIPTLVIVRPLEGAAQVRLVAKSWEDEQALRARLAMLEEAA